MMKKITSAFVIFMLTAFQGTRADNLQLLDMLRQEHLIPSSEKPIVQKELKISSALTEQPKNIEASKAVSPAKTLPKRVKGKHKKTDARVHMVIVAKGQELPKSDFEASPSVSNQPEPVKAAVVPSVPVTTPATVKVEPKPAAEVTQKVHQAKKRHTKVRKSGKKKQVAKKERAPAESVVNVHEVKAAEQPAVATTAEVKNAVQN